MYLSSHCAPVHRLRSYLPNVGDDSELVLAPGHYEAYLHSPKIKPGQLGSPHARLHAEFSENLGIKLGKVVCCDGVLLAAESLMKHGLPLPV